MPVIKYKGQDDQWHVIDNVAVTPINVVQTTGTSLTDVMSQSAVTNAIDDINDSLDNYTLTSATNALSGEVEQHIEDVDLHLSNTEKINLDALEANIGAITGITAQKVDSWDEAALSSHTHDNKAILDAISGAVGTMAYQDMSSFSSATDVNAALADKSDTGHTHPQYLTAVTAHNQSSETITAMTDYQIATSASSIVPSDTLNQAIGKLEKSFGGVKIVTISQQDYDNLETKDNNTLYIIND